MLKKSLLLVIVASLSCKTVARVALKYWTKKQVKEFVKNCETKSAGVIGEENAKKYCDCAVDFAAEKYRNYQDTKTLVLTDFIELVENCK